MGFEKKIDFFEIIEYIESNCYKIRYIKSQLYTLRIHDMLDNEMFYCRYQELKKLVISNSTSIMSQANDFKRVADSHKRNLDRLEQSLNFIQNNYSELVI